MDTKKNTYFIVALSRILACMLLISSFWPASNWLPPRLIVISQLVAGIGILYCRTWAYILVYILCTSHLAAWFFPSVVSTAITLFPFSISIARLLEFFDIPAMFTYYLLNVVFLILLILIHRQLRIYDLLDWHINKVHRRVWLRAVQILSALSAIIGIVAVTFSVFAIMQPPESDPGGMGGGFVYAFAIFFLFPFTCIAVGLFFVSSFYLKRSVEHQDKP